MKKKLLSVVLSAVMAAAMLTGCGGSSSGSTAEPAQEPAKEEAAAEEEAPAAEASGDKVTLTLWQDETWWPYTTWEGRIPEIINEKLGLDFEVTVAADDTALNLMIASGDLPDIVCTSTKIARMADPSVSYNLDELAQLAGDSEFPMHPVMRLVNISEDGNVYSLLCGYSPDYYMEEYDKAVYEGTGMVVRTDLYEEMGSPEIKSLDDLEKCLQYIKDNHPDIVPLTYNITHQNGFIKILCGATNTSSGFVDVNGEAVPFLFDPNFEKYYELMNDWYRKGFISDETFAYTSDSDDLELMIAGKLFCDSYYSDTAAAWTDDLEEAGVDFTTTQIIDIMQQPGAKWVTTNAGWRGLYVTKSCKDPVKAYEFLKFMYSEEGQCLTLWGEEGVDWNWNDTHEYPELNYDFDNPNTDDGMKFWGWLYHDGIRNTLPGYAGGGTTYAARKALTDITVAMPVLGTLRIPADSDELTIMNNLGELFKNQSVAIITAGSAEESKELYNQMLSTAYDLGAQQLIDWAAPRYAEKAAKYEEIRSLGADGK